MFVCLSIYCLFKANLPKMFTLICALWRKRTSYGNLLCVWRYFIVWVLFPSFPVYEIALHLPRPPFFSFCLPYFFSFLFPVWFFSFLFLWWGALTKQLRYPLVSIQSYRRFFFLSWRSLCMLIGRLLPGILPSRSFQLYFPYFPLA